MHNGKIRRTACNVLTTETFEKPSEIFSYLSYTTCHIKHYIPQGPIEGNPIIILSQGQHIYDIGLKIYIFISQYLQNYL